MNYEHPAVLLKNRHPGETLYVLGSGPSLDYFPETFFDHRTAIGCNYVYRRFPVRYTVAKELPLADMAESAQAGAIPVVSRHAYGNKNYPAPVRDLTEHHFVFEHQTNMHTGVNWDVLGTDELVVSYSTITSAIHLAAYMGARLILLCGAETGTIDGRQNFEGYTRAVPNAEEAAWYVGFLQQIRQQTITLRDKLRQVYGCDVMTLSPFVNWTHEGRTFQP